MSGADLPRLAETIAAALERTPHLNWTRPPVMQSIPARPDGPHSPTRQPTRPVVTAPEENSTAVSYNVFKPGGGRMGWDPPGRGGDAGVPSPTRWLRAAGLEPLSVKTTLSRALRAEAASVAATSSVGAAAASSTTKATPVSSRTVVRRGALLIAKAFVGNCLDAESGRTALSYSPAPISGSFTGLPGAAGDRTVCYASCCSSTVGPCPQ